MLKFHTGYLFIHHQKHLHETQDNSLSRCPVEAMNSSRWYHDAGPTCTKHGWVWEFCMDVCWDIHHHEPLLAVTVPWKNAFAVKISFSNIYCAAECHGLGIRARCSVVNIFTIFEGFNILDKTFVIAFWWNYTHI